jgi:hypothetical protein
MSILTLVTLIAVGLFFIWNNERQEKMDQDGPFDRVLHDAVIHYPDGTTLRFYDAKPTKSCMEAHVYRSRHPSVLSSNVDEIKDIIKYRETVEKHGIVMTFEQAAEVWVERYAADWRKNYTEGLKV